jgi:3-methylfumaryl-CoA hydratase
MVSLASQLPKNTTLSIAMRPRRVSPRRATCRHRRSRSGSVTVVPDDVLLFRYSALTFNGHRIHYDRRYVTEVEGYPGLIVHAP